MTITYTLQINEMQVAPQVDGHADVVVNVLWAYIGTDGTHSAGFGGSTPITFVPEDPFIPYADLTQAEVEAWVLGAWTPEQTQAQQDAIAAQLAVTTPPLPWA